MGDPRKFRSKFAGPIHPWQRARLDEERALKSEFGVASKSELWKVSSKVKSFARDAKRLIALRTPQAELETKQLLARVSRLGLLPENSKLDDVLALTVKDLLTRRLQTFVMKKGLARTPLQSRQFIVHGHVMVGPKKVCSPGYLVSVSEESLISLVGSSSLANPEHPERSIKAKPKPVRADVKEKRGRGARR
jgi:small subunit ribosomal protein S4